MAILSKALAATVVAVVACNVHAQSITVENENLKVEVDAFGFIRQNGLSGKGELSSGTLVGEGWGAGIRKGDNFIIECGATDNSLFGDGYDLLEDVELEQSRPGSGSYGGTVADSTVLCGDPPLLRVRHQYRTASRRPGCASAYEIKVSVTNRGCGVLGDVIYRRNNDFDVNFETDNFFTIKGVKEPWVELASNSLFCSTKPSTECENVEGVELPADMAGPFDQGSVFQLNLGPLASYERASLHFFYGIFSSPSEAEACIDGAKVDTYSLAVNEADKDGDTYMFAIRRSLAKGPAYKDEECTNWDESMPMIPSGATEYDHKSYEEKVAAKKEMSAEMQAVM